MKIKRKKSKKKLVIIVFVLLVIIASFASWNYFFNDSEVPVSSVENKINSTTQTQTIEEAKPTFNNAKIKKALKTWVASHGGTYSVTITDGSGKAIAQTNENQSYFAASIYKLYVAYIGYQKVDDGTYSSAEPYLYGWMRGECLREMIRQSHSPCAEKMWNELGKENLTNKLKEYGLKDTSMTGLATSSRDVAIILANINNGVDLSKKSQTAFLESMKKQIYRDALPVGFNESVVYDKVGFNEQLEYHDVAIIKLADGRKLIVSVLTTGVGSRNIAGLGSALQTAAQ